MSEEKTEETAAPEEASSEETKAGGAKTAPSPIPALHRESDRATRPGFRSPSNKKSKAQKKKRKKK